MTDIRGLSLECGMSETQATLKPQRELVLVGTVHRDPEGATKLRRFLARERPSTVAVEVSPYALCYRQRNGRRLRRRLRQRVTRAASTLGEARRCWGQIEAIYVQLMLPYEYRMALRYCRDAGADLYCLDSSDWSRRWIHAEWQQLLSCENVKALIEQSPENLQEEVNKDYRVAACLLTDQAEVLVSAFTKRWSADRHWQQREAQLAGGLERLYDQQQTGKLIYIGGWQHLLSPSSGTTLYQLIEHLRPSRALLQ